ncbi:peptidoglycan D,D-transpeptidase FtsI family protein [Pseudanabaena sp. PCC 6802]|uniref:peptidoglycan D,D-transpeptidase FtsI family protein n=1 Tax=Pseudanabaena sp. PCC 6802 TaxID=118173 RepID=UPI0003450997|nr:penicillin-binding protein 2 [Pseudanabaena sp. PCC 6802]
MALQTSLRSQRHLRQRTLLVGLILLLAAIGLIVRLVYLQVWTSAELLEKAKWQQMFQLRPFIPRRTITDRNDEVMAIDKPAYTLFAHPKLYKLKPEEIAEKLAPVLNKPAAKLLPLLSQPSSTTKIDSWLTEDVADNIFNLRIDGLDLAPQRHRLYPHKDLAAEVLGYVNIDHHGQAGVEFSQEKLLERTDQASDVVQDGRGRLIPSSLPAGVLRVDRTRLQLTIDARTQRVARQELRSQMKKFNAKRGAVLVMDAKNGELRTLVTEPTYDPNQFDRVPKEKYEVFKNWAVSDLYEPGSTFKPINVAIALEAGAIQSDTVFNDEGALTVGGWPVANFDFESRGAVGPLSISQILQRSSNVGMVHIIQQMKPSVYYGWLERVGLGDISGIDLPAETPSTLKPQEQFTTYVIEPATAAFGQGFSLTPVQLLQMHGILASGGKLLTPHVVKGVVNEEGEEAYQPKLNPPRQIFSPATTTKVLEMMVAVVEEGTGKPARIPGYRLGGKTGTAQKANPNNGGYTSGKITSFVGIFPAVEPRYVALAVIDEPVGADAFGSTVAAPIVKAVIEDIIVADKIPPSHLQELNSDALLTKPSPSADNPAATTSTSTNPAPDANSH